MTVPCSALSTLLGGLAADEFLERYWDREHFVRHGDVDELVGSVLPAECLDTDALLDAYRAPVMVLGRAVLAASEGYTDRVLVPTDRAREWYGRGGALELDNLDAYLPTLRGAAESVRKDLALPGGTFAKAIAYLSTEQGGLTPHFDAYANFVMQIRGVKTWWLMENHAVQAPMEHYSLHEYPLVPAELRSYMSGPMPQDYATDSTAVEMRPGSVMFLPRGMWHATAASEESISVNLNFSVPSWLDLVMGEIRSALIVDRRWRDHALAAGDPRQARAAHDRVDELLAELPTTISKLDPARILSRQSSPHDTYQLAQAVHHELLAMRDAFGGM